MTNRSLRRGPVAQLIAETLTAYGVDHIFGMEDPVQLFHHLDPKAIRAITIRDEKHGAIMAHGYAKVSGRPGICAATFGPGATNLITGLLEAQKSSLPVIAFIQEIPARNRERHASSEIDHVAALTPFTKKVLRIDVGARCCETVRRAFRIATSGRPGPVAVLCPADVMTEEVEAGVFAEAGFERFPAVRQRPGSEELARAAELLGAAKKPVIVAGGGSVLSGAAAEILALAERLNAPVATTMNGRGVIADSHPLSVGVLGSSTGGTLGSGRIANRVLQEADVVLIAGSRTGQICYMDWQQPKPDAAVIHLDIDPEEPGRNFPTDVTLLGDVRESLRELVALPGLEAGEGGEAPDYAAEKAAWGEEFKRAASANALPMRPEKVLAEISDRMAEDTILVTDASYVTGWAFSHIRNVGSEGRYLSPRGTGGIGWSLPAALGAKLADPDAPVVCITGDGAFGYVMAELETAARYRIPVVVVVFNNRTLGFQKHFELKLFGSYRECDLLDIDHAALAASLQCQGERVTEPDEIGPAIDRGLKSGGPYVIDAVIDSDSMAPILGLDQVQGGAETH